MQPVDKYRQEKLISLNLIFTYPVNWSEYKVLRDFIQNFYDAIGPDEWEERFTYKMEHNTLVMEASDVSFSYDWLIHIGASTKRDSKSLYAGFFGEGFKIASLCALRDHGWGVRMSSKDWELEVITQHMKVDNTNLQSLAYRVLRKKTSSPNSILILKPFSQRNMKEFRCAYLSFFSKGNPLIGEKIWSSERGAVYYRSKMEKPFGFPSTYNYSGPGIIFAAFQALGSFPYDLIFCIHNHRSRDRERNSFYKMDVISIVQSLIHKISPDAASKVLRVLKDRWYDYKKNYYDFESWYPIIFGLTEVIGDSSEFREKWKETFPNLLVAKKVKSGDLFKKNRRTQALAWLRNEKIKYKLVQDGFLNLGYPELERLCEENDGFNVTREPTATETKYITLLEEIVLTFFKDFLHENKLPPCQIIKSIGSAWAGMTSCVRLSTPKTTRSGKEIKFLLPYIAIKRNLFNKYLFANALSTYLHELAHCFGGDKSPAFSLVLTEMLEITINHSHEIEKFRFNWENIDSEVKEHHHVSLVEQEGGIASNSQITYELDGNTGREAGEVVENIRVRL